MSAYQPSLADRAQKRAFAALMRLPARLKRTLAGPPLVIDDAPLDLDVQMGLRILAALKTPEMTELEPTGARAVLEQESWMFGGPRVEVGEVQDLTIPGRGGPIPARLYRPPHVGGRLPLLLWFHGGGWVLGSIESHDRLARAICADAEVAVLNVGYRLAPEHRFPAAVDDSLDAFRWAREQAADLGIDPARIGVAGDSAGGTLAAVVSWTTTRSGEPAPSFQALFVPVTDLAARDTASYRHFASGFFLSAAEMRWNVDHYLGPDGDGTDPLASPLYAQDLSGLPPTYVAVAGFDVLRDEGVAYAERLAAAGVPVTLRRHRDAVHPFINILVTPLGQRALHEAVGAIRAGLGVGRMRLAGQDQGRG